MSIAMFFGRFQHEFKKTFCTFANGIMLDADDSASD